MNVLIVYCHPEPHSFNHAMFQTACQALQKNHHKIRISDLHRMKFDPVSGRSAYKTVKNPERFRQQLEEMYASERFGFADFIENEIEKIEDCDLMIWQFPLWWCSIPALLKGWVDRVFAMGRIYGGGHMYETGFCAGKKALLSLTTGGGMELYQPGGANGDIMDLLKPVWHGTLQFAGFDILTPQIVYAPAKMSATMRRQVLESYSARLAKIENEPLYGETPPSTAVIPGNHLPGTAVIMREHFSITLPYRW